MTELKWKDKYYCYSQYVSPLDHNLDLFPVVWQFRWESWVEYFLFFDVLPFDLYLLNPEVHVRGSKRSDN